jgi:glycosyltransferase involved in cell wall biosynthesis
MPIERDVTAIINTFERSQSLRRLVRSIRKFYPKLHIIVADGSFQPNPIAQVEYIRLPPDSGVSSGRNACLERVKTPFFLLLDDDNEFSRCTRIERLLATIQDFDVDLAAGEYTRCKSRLLWIRKKPEPFVGTIKRVGSQLTITPGYRVVKPGLNSCDLAHNFFVARTERIRKIGGWADVLKINEHAEFFVRFKERGLKAAYCPEVTVRHWFARSANYVRYRDRNFWPLAAQLMGITKLIDMSGRVHEFPVGRAA